MDNLNNTSLELDINEKLLNELKVDLSKVIKDVKIFNCFIIDLETIQLTKIGGFINNNFKYINENTWYSCRFTADLINTVTNERITSPVTFVFNRQPEHDRDTKKFNYNNIITRLDVVKFNLIK